MVLVQQHGMRQAASEDEDAGSSSNEPPDVSANGYEPQGPMPSGWAPAGNQGQVALCTQQHGALQAVAAPRQPTACSAAEGPFCVRLERPQATAAVVQDLVSAFPKAPDCVTDVKGPLMELQRVGSHTMDVRVVHSFTAHFPCPLPDAHDRSKHVKIERQPDGSEYCVWEPASISNACGALGCAEMAAAYSDSPARQPRVSIEVHGSPSGSQEDGGDGGSAQQLPQQDVHSTGSSSQQVLPLGSPTHGLQPLAAMGTSESAPAGPAAGAGGGGNGALFNPFGAVADLPPFSTGATSGWGRYHGAGAPDPQRTRSKELTWRGPVVAAASAAAGVVGPGRAPSMATPIIEEVSTSSGSSTRSGSSSEGPQRKGSGGPLPVIELPKDHYEQQQWRQQGPQGVYRSPFEAALVMPAGEYVSLSQLQPNGPQAEGTPAAAGPQRGAAPAPQQRAADWSLICPDQKQQQQQQQQQQPRTLVLSRGPGGLQRAGSVGFRPRCEWELDPSKVLIGRRLAVGGFAEVFLGKYEGTAVAVKRLLTLDASTTERFISEVRILARLRHPNLILFMGYCTKPDLCIVSEYVNKGSLFSVLRQNERDHHKLEQKLQRVVAVSVARGMSYLHTRTPPILHLDLKTPNILVDDRWRVKITDFGLSRARQATYVSASGQGGTPEWMAPELLCCREVAEPADVYSYGVVLWELLSGEAPWEGYNPMQVIGLVGYQHQSLALPTEGDPFLIHLCEICMHQDPAKRPTFPQIVAMLDQQYGPAAWADQVQPLLQPRVPVAVPAAAMGAPARQAPLLLMPPPAALDAHGAAQEASGVSAATAVGAAAHGDLPLHTHVDGHEPQQQESEQQQQQLGVSEGLKASAKRHSGALGATEAAADVQRDSVPSRQATDQQAVRRLLSGTTPLADEQLQQPHASAAAEDDVEQQQAPAVQARVRSPFLAAASPAPALYAPVAVAAGPQPPASPFAAVAAAAETGGCQEPVGPLAAADGAGQRPLGTSPFADAAAMQGDHRQGEALPSPFAGVSGNQLPSQHGASAAFTGMGGKAGVSHMQFGTSPEDKQLQHPSRHLQGGNIADAWGSALSLCRPSTAGSHESLPGMHAAAGAGAGGSLPMEASASSGEMLHERSAHLPAVPAGLGSPAGLLGASGAGPGSQAQAVAAAAAAAPASTTSGDASSVSLTTWTEPSIGHSLWPSVTSRTVSSGSLGLTAPSQVVQPGSLPALPAPASGCAAAAGVITGACDTTTCRPPPLSSPASLAGAASSAAASAAASKLAGAEEKRAVAPPMPATASQPTGLAAAAAVEAVGGPAPRCYVKGRFHVTADLPRDQTSPSISLRRVRSQGHLPGASPEPAAGTRQHSRVSESGGAGVQQRVSRASCSCLNEAGQRTPLQVPNKGTSGATAAAVAGTGVAAEVVPPMMTSQQQPQPQQPQLQHVAPQASMHVQQPQQMTMYDVLQQQQLLLHAMMHQQQQLQATASGGLLGAGQQAITSLPQVVYSSIATIPGPGLPVQHSLDGLCGSGSCSSSSGAMCSHHAGPMYSSMQTVNSAPGLDLNAMSAPPAPAAMSYPSSAADAAYGPTGLPLTPCFDVIPPAYVSASPQHMAPALAGGAGPSTCTCTGSSSGAATPAAVTGLSAPMHASYAAAAATTLAQLGASGAAVQPAAEAAAAGGMGATGGMSTGQVWDGVGGYLPVPSSAPTPAGTPAMLSPVIGFPAAAGVNPVLGTPWGCHLGGPYSSSQAAGSAYGLQPHAASMLQLQQPQRITVLPVVQQLAYPDLQLLAAQRTAEGLRVLEPLQAGTPRAAAVGSGLQAPPCTPPPPPRHDGLPVSVSDESLKCFSPVPAGTPAAAGGAAAAPPGALAATPSHQEWLAGASSVPAAPGAAAAAAAGSAGGAAWEPSLCSPRRALVHHESLPNLRINVPLRGPASTSPTPMALSPSSACSSSSRSYRKGRFSVTLGHSGHYGSTCSLSILVLEEAREEAEGGAAGTSLSSATHGVPGSASCSHLPSMATRGIMSDPGSTGEQVRATPAPAASQVGGVEAAPVPLSGAPTWPEVRAGTPGPLGQPSSTSGGLASGGSSGCLATAPGSAPRSSRKPPLGRNSYPGASSTPPSAAAATAGAGVGPFAVPRRGTYGPGGEPHPPGPAVGMAATPTGDRPLPIGGSAGSSACSSRRVSIEHSPLGQGSGAAGGGAGHPILLTSQSSKRRCDGPARHVSFCDDAGAGAAVGAPPVGPMVCPQVLATQQQQQPAVKPLFERRAVAPVAPLVPPGLMPASSGQLNSGGSGSSQLGSAPDHGSKVVQRTVSAPTSSSAGAPSSSSLFSSKSGPSILQQKDYCRGRFHVHEALVAGCGTAAKTAAGVGAPPPTPTAGPGPCATTSGAPPGATLAPIAAAGAAAPPVLRGAASQPALDTALVSSMQAQDRHYVGSAAHLSTASAPGGMSTASAGPVLSTGGASAGSGTADMAATLGLARPSRCSSAASSVAGYGSGTPPSPQQQPSFTSSAGSVAATPAAAAAPAAVFNFRVGRFTVREEHGSSQCPSAASSRPASPRPTEGDRSLSKLGSSRQQSFPGSAGGAAAPSQQAARVPAPTPAATLPVTAPAAPAASIVVPAAEATTFGGVGVRQLTPRLSEAGGAAAAAGAGAASGGGVAAGPAPTVCRQVGRFVVTQQGPATRPGTATTASAVGSGAATPPVPAQPLEAARGLAKAAVTPAAGPAARLPPEVPSSMGLAVLECAVCSTPNSLPVGPLTAAGVAVGSQPGSGASAAAAVGVAVAPGQMPRTGAAADGSRVVPVPADIIRLSSQSVAPGSGDTGVARCLVTCGSCGSPLHHASAAMLNPVPWPGNQEPAPAAAGKGSLAWLLPAAAFGVAGSAANAMGGAMQPGVPSTLAIAAAPAAPVAPAAPAAAGAPTGLLAEAAGRVLQQRALQQQQQGQGGPIGSSEGHSGSCYSPNCTPSQATSPVAVPWGVSGALCHPAPQQTASCGGSKGLGVAAAAAGGASAAGPWMGPVQLTDAGRPDQQSSSIPAAPGGYKEAPTAAQPRLPSEAVAAGLSGLLQQEGRGVQGAEGGTHHTYHTPQPSPAAGSAALSAQTSGALLPGHPALPRLGSMLTDGPRSFPLPLSALLDVSPGSSMSSTRSSDGGSGRTISPLPAAAQPVETEACNSRQGAGVGPALAAGGAGVGSRGLPDVELDGRSASDGTKDQQRLPAAAVAPGGHSWSGDAVLQSQGAPTRQLDRSPRGAPPAAAAALSGPVARGAAVAMGSSGTSSGASRLGGGHVAAEAGAGDAPHSARGAHPPQQQQQQQQLVSPRHLRPVSSAGDPAGDSPGRGSSSRGSCAPRAEVVLPPSGGSKAGELVMAAAAGGISASGGESRGGTPLSGHDPAAAAVGLAEPDVGTPRSDQLSRLASQGLE